MFYDRFYMTNLYNIIYIIFLQDFLYLIHNNIIKCILYNLLRGNIKRLILRLTNASEKRNECPRLSRGVCSFHCPPSGNKFQGWSETVTLHVLLTNSQARAPSAFPLGHPRPFCPCFSVGTLRGATANTRSTRAV